MREATPGASGMTPAGPGTPARLRIEHGPRPLGTGFRHPRLSWRLPPAAQGQLSYQVRATIDGTAQTAHPADAPEPFLRPWPFPALGSRSRVAWQVRVRSRAGWSDWSAAHEFETGLLEPADWNGSRFIGTTDPDPLPPRGQRGALYLRRRFAISEPPERARVYATAHGVYELHLDGTRIGDLELTPGFTAYRSHLEVQAYDITGLCGPGEHELIATVTDGWWRGATGAFHLDQVYGTSLALLAQVEITGHAGTRRVIATGSGWQVTTHGAITAADLMEGQRTDQAIPFPPASGWQDAVVLGTPDARLTTSPAPATRRTGQYRPASVTRLDAGRQVVDLGANISGWARVDGSVLGPAGNTVRLRHGERLGEDGDVDTTHLDITLPGLPPVSVGMTDEVVSAGPAAPVFEPRHTTHGFRYVSVTGARDVSPDDVTGVMVHTDMARTGWFSCSDERLNVLHEAVVLSFRGNACEIPTDCPQRERAGWTGDWQLFIPAAAFLYDVAGLSTRWLRDLAADQWDDGRVPNFVPDSIMRRTGRNAEITGSAGWGDAAVYVPHQVWQSYGDTEILARQYASMRSWVEFALGRAAAGRHPARAAARPEPAAHEAWLWDAGFHWGEWLEPGVDSFALLASGADMADVATAYLYRSTATLAQVAGLIGKAADARHYSAVAGKVRAAWQAEFVTAAGSVTPATQANLTRALAFGLIDDQHRDHVAANLVTLIRAAGNHLGTGFLATPFLLPALADHGHLDVAYDLLLQASAPSWLHMTESGATTIWENWEGLDSDGKGSLNHYSKGAVITFLHQYVAGLRPVPGIPAYREFEVRPCPGGGITAAEARLDTPYGPAGTAWRLDEQGTFTLDVDVAPGTRAHVTLPGGSTRACGPGTHHLTGHLPGR
jgi:alpha-L-rhamnosidase